MTKKVDENIPPNLYLDCNDNQLLLSFVVAGAVVLFVVADHLTPNHNRDDTHSNYRFAAAPKDDDQSNDMYVSFVLYMYNRRIPGHHIK